MKHKEYTFKATIIETKEQLDNIMKRDKYRNWTEDDFLTVSTFMDKTTFQPWIVLALKKPGVPFMDWLKFAMPMELAIKEDSKEKDVMDNFEIEKKPWWRFWA
jgi:hypothetical protein